MIDALNKRCIGCGACASVCPQNCIAMQQDKEGFYYPVIDAQKCIDCGACNRVCIAENTVYKQNSLAAYAAYSKNNEQREKSSSGAVFYELAKYILDNNGVVFGAAFDADLSVKHICIDSIDDLNKLQTSKYVQSKTDGVFANVKKLLKQEKQVLFVGTPCQCNALSLFLGKSYDNLLLVDFICHGVPSPLVWKKYLESLNIKNITCVNFRDKTFGWKNFSFSAKNISQEYKSVYSNNPYMKLFLSDLTLRLSCYDCTCKFPNKSSDITIGDLWGVENIASEMNDDKGISLVVVNTQKGNGVLNTIFDNCIFKELDFNAAVKSNGLALRSPALPENRKKLFNKLCAERVINFDNLAKKYIKHPSLIKRIVKKIIRIIRRVL